MDDVDGFGCVVNEAGEVEYRWVLGTTGAEKPCVASGLYKVRS